MARLGNVLCTAEHRLLGPAAACDPVTWRVLPAARIAINDN
jgi:hypothetical protein